MLDFIVFNYWQRIYAKITVEIIHESGMRLYGGTITGPPTNAGDWKMVLNIVRTLEEIVGSSKFKISLAEFLNKANDLNFLYHMITAPTILYKANIEDSPP